MPAAVLAGGASRRMGRPKAELPYGAGTLLEFQVVAAGGALRGGARRRQGAARVCGRAGRASSSTGCREHAAIHGLVRALAEADDRLFVLAVDLPAIAPALLRAIAERSLATDAAALVPRADGRLQPLAAVWRRSVLAAAEAEDRRRADSRCRGWRRRSGRRCSRRVAWRAFDPSGAAFTNLNTLEQYAAQRERA